MSSENKNRKPRTKKQVVAIANFSDLTEYPESVEHEHDNDDNYHYRRLQTKTSTTGTIIRARARRIHNFSLFRRSLLWFRFLFFDSNQCAQTVRRKHERRRIGAMFEPGGCMRTWFLYWNTETLRNEFRFFRSHPNCEQRRTKSLYDYLFSAAHHIPQENTETVLFLTTDMRLSA